MANIPHSGEELNSSDDEIFFGKLSLKELKKHIFWNNYGQSKTYTRVSPQDRNNSMHIIESHSQPNLRNPIVNNLEFSSVPGSPASGNRKSDESFIQMENMVSKLCSSPGKAESLELNNTFEVIEYILNNGPNQNTNKSETKKDVQTEKICSLTLVPSKTIPLPSKTSPLSSKKSPDKIITPRPTSPKEKNETAKKESPKYFTPAKSEKKLQTDVFSTPSSNVIKTKTPTFKTPNPFSQKKPSAPSMRKTPSKSNAYQHIKSPIATYINNCPVTPLVKNIHPRKPLPATSSIPKFVKNPQQNKFQNKENINLPSIAYKSAKKTKVIHIPDEEKLPQSQWAKKISSTLQRPTVMKHQNRETNFSTKPLNLQEDSFANLSSVQAEVSVCTQKTAFKTKKHL